MQITRGNIFIVNLIERDARGQEIGKQRPAVIIQANPWNENLTSTIILPLTSRIPVYKSPLTIVIGKDESNLEKDSYVLFPQLRAIDKSRLVKNIGRLSETKLKEINQNLSLILGLIPLD